MVLGKWQSREVELGIRRDQWVLGIPPVLRDSKLGSAPYNCPPSLGHKYRVQFGFHLRDQFAQHKFVVSQYNELDRKLGLQLWLVVDSVVVVDKYPRVGVQLRVQHTLFLGHYKVGEEGNPSGFGVRQG